MDDFLLGPAGEAYLRHEYVRLGRSASAIARERGTTAAAVIRALKGHGIHVRGRSEARKVGLAMGNLDAPMRDRKHTPEARERIREALLRFHRKKEDGDGATSQG